MNIKFEALRKVQNDFTAKNAKDGGEMMLKNSSKSNSRKASKPMKDCEFYPNNHGKPLTCFKQENKMTGFVLLNSFTL